MKNIKPVSWEFYRGFHDIKYHQFCWHSKDSFITTKLRASIIIDYKKAKYWGGEERRGERGEVGCKLAASLDIRTKKLCERNMLTLY